MIDDTKCHHSYRRGAAMIRYLYANELDKFPKLKASMFRNRADQFKTRLGWDVTVNEHGEERDQYDDLNPLYLIYENVDGPQRDAR
jgi:N-acyl-L-homoserine lactone synthetase